MKRLLNQNKFIILCNTPLNHFASNILKYLDYKKKLQQNNLTDENPTFLLNLLIKHFFYCCI